MYIAGVISIIVGVGLLIGGTVHDDWLKQKGPFQTSITIHWADRTGARWFTGPIKYDGVPNKHGPTDDVFVVKKMLDAAGVYIGQIPTDNKPEKDAPHADE